MNSSLILFTAQICLSPTCSFFRYTECPNFELGELGKIEKSEGKENEEILTFVFPVSNSFLFNSPERQSYITLFSHSCSLHLFFKGHRHHWHPSLLQPTGAPGHKVDEGEREGKMRMRGNERWGWEERKEKDGEEMEREWWKRGICCKWVVGELSCNDCTCPYFWSENRLTSFLSFHLSSRKSPSSRNLFIIYTWSSFFHSFPHFTHFPCYSPNLISFETNHFLLSLIDFSITDSFFHSSIHLFSHWVIFAFKN